MINSIRNMKCSNCGKIYKRKKAYNNHVLLCQISTEDVVDSILPTQKEMWYLIKKLIKKTNIQQRKIEVLERVVNRDVKNINMLEWLNKNIKLDMGLDDWLKNEVIVTMDTIECIINSNFERGIYTILDNSINKETVPFKAFSHKSTQLYIYDKSIWKKATKSDIKKIFFKLQLKILKKNNEWEKTLDDYEIQSLNHLKKQDKILISGDKIKERCYKNIQKIIINLTKINLNKMAKFKFYI